MSQPEKLRARVNAEIEALRRRHGTLKQEHVVEAARHKGTALYEDFDRQGLWDDARAAERARLEYAGRIIRLYVVVKDENSPPIRALVSLIDDRKKRSGFPGYRDLDEVLNDDDLREQLMQTALMELRAVRRKYESIRALAGVWKAIDKADRRLTPQEKQELRPSA